MSSAHLREQSDSRRNHIGNALGVAGAGLVGGGIIGAGIGVPKSILPSIINVAQGEDSNYGGYIGNSASSAAVGGSVGAALGYMLPTSAGEGMRGAMMQMADNKFSYEKATPGGKRRAGAVLGSAIGATGGSAGQMLMNIIHSLNNATPQEMG